MACNTNNLSIAGNLNGTTNDITRSYHTTIGYLASTTANISGIYDMSGGAHENVMGYNTAANIVGGKSGITSIYSDFFTNSKWNCYYDIYYKSNSNFVYTSRILGDATGEMGPFQNFTDPDGYVRPRASWYGDYGYFVDYDAVWFGRGGSWRDGIAAGVFDFSRSPGDASNLISFRVVLTP